MGMLKDALGPAMGAGQANNGLNGVMSKVKGMFGQKNDSSTPENWRAPSPAPLPDLDEPRSSRNYVRRDSDVDEGEESEDDLPPPCDSRREGTQLRDDRRVLATPQVYDEYEVPARSPRRLGGEERNLRPRVPLEQYGPPQGQQSWGQGPGMGPPPGAYGDAYGGRRQRRDRGDRRGRRDMQQGGGYGGGGYGYGGYGGGGRNGGRRGNGGMGGMMGMAMYGGGGGC